MKTAYEYTKECLAKVTPSMAYPGGDVAAWQKGARAKLRELIGLDRFVQVAPDLQIEFDKTENGVRELRFTFESEAGYRVPCHLVLPADAKKPPVMLCIQGHSTGMHISLGRPKYPQDQQTISGGDRDFCVRAVKEGWAAVAIEQRSFGECGGNPTGPRCLEATMTNLLFGRTTIGERVWDCMRLMDVLEAAFSDLVDVNTMGCMGNSGGGTTVAYLAALDERLVLAMPSCAMCTWGASIGAMEHCVCNYVPHIAEFFDMGDLMAMAWPKYYVQVNGAEDPIFPQPGAKAVFEFGKAAYAAVGDGDRCTLVLGNGAHRFYADDAWPHVHRLLGR